MVLRMDKKSLLRRSCIGAASLVALGATGLATATPASAETVTPYSSSIDIGGGAAHLTATLTFVSKNEFKLTNVKLCDKASDSKAPEFNPWDQYGPYPGEKDSKGNGECITTPSLDYISGSTIDYIQLHVYACNPDYTACTAGEWSVKHNNPNA